MTESKPYLSFVHWNLLCIVVLFCLLTGDGCSHQHHADPDNSSAPHTHPHLDPDPHTLPNIAEQPPAATTATTANTEKPTPNNTQKNNTPEQNINDILTRMLRAYQNANSYSDNATGRIVGQMVQPNTPPAAWACNVTFLKSGKLKIDCNEGKLVSNGEDCFAQIKSIPDQVLKFPTPRPFSFAKLYSDFELDRAMNIIFPREILRFPPQLILLFAKDPLKTLLPAGSTAELLTPQNVGNIPCDVIKIKHERGDRIIWISRLNSALVRFDYVVEGLLVAADFESVRTIRIDINNAQFNQEITDDTFKITPSKQAKYVSELKPIETEILGKRLLNAEALWVEELIFPDNAKTNLTNSPAPQNPPNNLPKNTNTQNTNTQNTNTQNTNQKETDTKNTAAKKNAENNTEKTAEKTVEKTTEKTADKAESKGKRISIAELRGDISFFCFWTTWSEPCRQAIAEFAAAAEEFEKINAANNTNPPNANETDSTKKNNEKPKNNVRFFIVNSDELESGAVSDRAVLLKSFCDSWRVPSPVWFDSDGVLTDSFCVDSFPTVVVIGVDNRVEFYARGGIRASAIGTLVREIAEDKKPYEKILNDLQKSLQQRKLQLANELKIMSERDFFASICISTEPAVKPSFAPMLAPKTFKLKEAWRQNLAATGNIAILNNISLPKEELPKDVQPQKATPKEATPKEGQNQPQKSADVKEKIAASEQGISVEEFGVGVVILVPCDGNNVAVIDLGGRLLRKVKPLGFSADEMLTLVRTSEDFKGVNYIGLSSNNGNAVHIFDSNLVPKLRYVPSAGLPDVKQTISDFRFVDLDGDDEPEVAVGTVLFDDGIVGGDSIRVVDLRGREIWQDNLISSPFQIDDYYHNGKRGLYGLDAVTANAATIRKYDAAGRRLDVMDFDGRFVRVFAVDKSSGDLCAIIANADNTETAIAVFNESGTIRWRKVLPTDEYQLISVDLQGNNKRVWFVIGRDGTITVFDRSGQILDSFAIGAQPTGLAVVANMLIIATGNEVIAWNIEK
ncbi:MAG: redoxin domain-containing protein [Planctomycetaceae bacterium]|nr:redoxin domain-containing protein [Planctomycetaceae bacterium]